ncbi:MAG: hypothetical protein WAV51_02950 [Microgenomates group bacterium]
MNIKNKKILNFLGLLVVLVLGVVAILPFLGNRFLPTHDGEYHIIRFMEFYRMLSQGYLFPRWAPTINSGYGLPLFQFMYPFPNYMAALFHVFGVEFVTAFKYTSAFAYLSALVFCFLWLKTKWSQKSASFGTIAAAFVPYWFVELYVRGSIGEIWAITFLFLGFFSIEKRSGFLLTLAACLLLLSHNGLSIIFLPILGLYVLYRLSAKWLACLVLGIGLSAWFWLPAVAESHYMVGLNTVSVIDHFASIPELLIPSWGTEFSGVGSSGNKMSLQIGAAVLLWVGYIIFRLKKASTKQKRELFVVIGIMAVSIYLVLPSSVWIWQHVPVLPYLQYPWRLLVLMIPFTAWASAFTTEQSKKLWIPILLVCCSVLFAFPYTRGAQYESRNDAYYASRSNFTDGTSSMGNSLSTIWTPWKETKSLTIATDTEGNPIIVDGPNEKYLDRQYTVSLGSDTVIRFHILYFPGWTAYVDGVSTPIDYQSQGTIDVRVPKGTHIVRLVMQETLIRTLADAVSVASLVIFAILGILWYRRKHQ